MNTDLKPGDRVAFDVPGKQSPYGYGVVTYVQDGVTRVKPDNAIPLGFQMQNIRKVGQ